MKKLLSLLLVGTFAIGSVAYTANPADAGERAKRIRVEGSAGAGATIDRSVERGEKGERTIMRNATGDNGRTAESETKVKFDRESGTMSSETSGAAANGKTWTGNKTAVKTETGVTVKSNATGQNGRGYETEKDIVKNEDGSYSAKSTYTGSNGKTFVHEATAVKTEDGVQRTQTWVDPNGETKERTVNGSVNANGYNKTIIGPNGKTRSWTATGVNAGVND